MREAFREGQKQEIARNTEGELPEFKIFDLLSSIGNGENKALELIAMKEGVIYSKNALWQEVMDHQTKGREWRMSKTTPFSHCEDSLSPIGLVTKEALSTDGTAWGYEITQYGLRTGVPFAGLLLKWSYEHPGYSLYKMFGKTGSTSIKDEQALEKKRAPETRYKIFWEIATNPSNRIRLTDIAIEIRENPSSSFMHEHLMSLNKNRIISYEAVEMGKPYSYFKPTDAILTGRPEAHQHQKTLSDRVYELLIEDLQQRPNGFLSSEEIVNSLMERFPKYQEWKRNGLHENVTNILSHFVKQGYMERQRFSRTFRSEIMISDEQREAILSLVTFIDKFKNEDNQTIEDGRRFAQKVLSDPKLFSELMVKAKEVSSQANMTNREDMHAHLINILYEHPSSTVNQIQEILEKGYGKKISREGIRYNLNALVKDEKIISEKTKAGNEYRVVEEESQTPSAQN